MNKQNSNIWNKYSIWSLILVVSLYVGFYGIDFLDVNGFSFPEGVEFLFFISFFVSLIFSSFSIYFIRKSEMGGTYIVVICLILTLLFPVGAILYARIVLSGWSGLFT